MKKFFMIFSVVLFVLLCGCEQPASGGNSDTETGLLAQGSGDGYSWQVQRNITQEDGITNDAIGYQLKEESTGKTITFGIVKMSSGSNISYHGAVIANRKDSAFDNEFWNQCLIQGSELVTMSNAISIPQAEDDGSFSFIITGSLSESDITKLKNATLITVALNSTTASERNTLFAVDMSFKKALMRFF